MKKSFIHFFSKSLGILICFLCLACGSSSSSDGDDDGGDGLGGDPAGDVIFPATDVAADLNYSATITGSGSSRFGTIAITDSAGTVEINNETLNTIIYEYIPWDDAGYNLYQGIAFSDSDMFVYWLYCRTSNDALATIYYESANTYGMTHETATGTCDYAATASQPTFALTELPLTMGSLVSGYTITGDLLSYNGTAAGSYTYDFDGTTFDLYPFEEVDCSDCGGDGWWELHSVAYDVDSAKACFVILYFMAGDEASVYAQYSLCFPDLDNIDAVFSADWVRE